jgi:hypothetical protein
MKVTLIDTQKLEDNLQMLERRISQLEKNEQKRPIIDPNQDREIELVMLREIIERKSDYILYLTQYLSKFVIANNEWEIIRNNY